MLKFFRALLPKPPSTEPPIYPYRQGIIAGRAGLNFIDNPYTTNTSSINSGVLWLLGWCEGMKTKV